MAALLLKDIGDRRAGILQCNRENHYVAPEPAKFALLYRGSQQGLRLFNDRDELLVQNVYSNSMKKFVHVIEEPVLKGLLDYQEDPSY